MGSSSLSIFVNFLINNTTNITKHFEYSVSTQCLWICGIVLLYGGLILVIKMVHRILLTYLESASFSELYKATERDDVITIMRILNQHPDYVNKFKKPEGYTPFMVACAKANTQIVKYMLTKGANVSMKSKNNETPFHLAVFFCIMHKVSIILVFPNRFVETFFSITKMLLVSENCTTPGQTLTNQAETTLLLYKWPQFSVMCP